MSISSGERTQDDQPSTGTTGALLAEDDAVHERNAPEGGPGGAIPPPPKQSSHWLSFAIVAGIVVILDQVTKRYVDAHLALQESWPSESWPVRFLHVKNTGAAFSMLQNQTFFLTIMSLFGLGAIALYFWFRPSDHPLLRYALALQLGGAIGNLIDRVRYGTVTDFIKFPHFAVFNVADSAITIGVTIVVLFLLFGGERMARGSGRSP